VSIALPAKIAELERARRDVAHFTALAQRHPSSARAAMLLDGARAWQRRCEQFLAAAGRKP
jgi:hypothetical protein